jgi:hypothetical protein
MVIKQAMDQANDGEYSEEDEEEEKSPATIRAHNPLNSFTNEKSNALVRNMRRYSKG